MNKTAYTMLSNHNKYKVQRLLNGLLLLSLSFLYSCKHDDLLIPKPNENIRPAGDFIRNNFDFQLFYAALDYTGLVDELNAEGSFTVLALNDRAFKGMGIHTKENILHLNKDSLREAMQYHIIKERRLTTSSIPTNAVDVRYETLSSSSPYASAITGDRKFYFNGSQLIRTNIELSNGVLHVLDKMLQYHKGKTVQDFLASQPNYSIFVAGLKKFGLWNELSQPGPFTIFPPENNAFINKGITLQMMEDLNADNYNGNRLLGQYIIYNNHFFISDQYLFYRVGGEYTYAPNLRNDDWYVHINCINAYSANPGDAHYTNFPTFSLWKPPVGSTPFGTRIGPEIQSNNNGVIPAIENYDRLFENGIVHHLTGITAVPLDLIK
ncbi:fasciclin domain-containing protein [Gynurincola endophyticus]|uniref:fasciclin domain-containing protein n=1 Tax=Gynurincola endophyticus TaxID=2479004 RepID=UPI000F8F4B3E|nr:fasciclin domain-containing protein [Gynurincola endophyticus]